MVQKYVSIPRSTIKPQIILVPFCFWAVHTEFFYNFAEVSYFLILIFMGSTNTKLELLYMHKKVRKSHFWLLNMIFLIKIQIGKDQYNSMYGTGYI